jgi:RNA polymerase sigma-70 factor (ECF subfamily)
MSMIATASRDAAVRACDDNQISCNCDPTAPAERLGAPRTIDAAVARLPRLYREPYVLSELEGLSNAEIGAQLGLSLPAVKSRIHRARLLLRRVLAPHFEATALGQAS